MLRSWCIALCLAVSAAAAAPVAADSPRLVVLITVDQLAGDAIERGRDRFGPGGFRWLLEHGVHYTNARYQHASTFTASGHATLVTGAGPAEHGLVANGWQDPATGRRVYAVENDRYRILGRPPAPHVGTSPRNLLVTTIGDELVRTTDGAARVFAVSVKDRGAIIPAGHLGTAYWYSSANGTFTTSTYYMDALPEWAQAWNAAGHVERYRGREWTLLLDAAAYTHTDDRPFERSVGSLDRTFPHRLDDAGGRTLSQILPFTPMGDEHTLAFALALLEHERLGRGEAPDLLAVGFSCTDYIGHTFGPRSLEAEDNLLRLDRTIAALLAAVDETVGLDHAIVVLSSDHGVADCVEWTHEQTCEAGGLECPRLEHARNGMVMLTEDPIEGCGASGRVFPDRLLARANAAIGKAFAVDETLAVGFRNPGMSLDSARIEALGLDQAAVEAVVATELASVPGVARVFTRSQMLETPSGQDDAIEAAVRRAFHPARSPDVIVVQRPHWHLYHNPALHAAMHGSPYDYDTHVPIVIAAPGVGPQAIDRRVAPVDVAPTLARLLGVSDPSGSVGVVLEEFDGR